MKSPPPLLLPPVLGKVEEVLPRPEEPMAEEELEPLEDPELVDDVDDEEELDATLPVVVVVPRRLVAAVNADDALDDVVDEPEELVELDENGTR